MIRRRLFFFAALLAALLFQIFSASYLAAFSLWIAVCLPLLGFVLSLPAMLGLVVRLTPQQNAVRRGATARWMVTAMNRYRLPLARIELHLQMKNRMSGEVWTRRLLLSGASRAVYQFVDVETPHCGMLECVVTRVRVCDCLGLVSFRRRMDLSALLPLLPLALEPEPLPEGADAQQATVLLPRPGGVGEDYELRPYRPGDPIKWIHWKLTSKRDEVIFREVLEPQERIPVLTFDHFGPLDDVDRVLDRLNALGRALAERQRHFQVCWVHPVSGALRRYDVGGARELDRCIAAILEDPAPPEGRSILEYGALPGNGWRFHMEAEQEEARHA